MVQILALFLLPEFTQLSHPDSTSARLILRNLYASYVSTENARVAQVVSLVLCRVFLEVAVACLDEARMAVAAAKKGGDNFLVAFAQLTLAQASTSAT
eukprot:4798759-Amphidinium_carterae.1